jgi:hypothetical protein
MITKCKEQYQVKISNRFAALESLDINMDISRASESIRGFIEISARESYKLKEHKLLFE